MATDSWKTVRRSVTSLHLDTKNPRLGRETSAQAPREIIQYLFDHDKAMDVAQSIATRGYFPNEALLAVKENNQLVVVEGNRRLAALKGLLQPGLLEGSKQRQLDRLSKKMEDPSAISTVPVTIAPSRRATDRQIAGRHIGTPVLAWQAENRASFILEKIDEGYTNEELNDQLGFSPADIQAARQTRAIADMARSLDLPDEVKAKLEKPRTSIFTTLERVFDSTVGREYLKVKPDTNHGVRGETTKGEFVKGFKKLVTDIAVGNESSRTLNSSDDIRRYFKSFDKNDLPGKKKGSFVPADIIKGRSVASPPAETKPQIKPKSKQLSKTVLPRDFKVRFGNDRLKEIRDELAKMERDKFPNAGAVLLRVFLELSILDYLKRTGELPGIIEKIERKIKGKLRFGIPNLRQLVPEINRIAKKKLSQADAQKVEKAVKYDSAAPFTISELHGFVHQDDLPTARDIEQFWKRTESLFRLMLEQDIEGASK